MTTTRRVVSNNEKRTAIYFLLYVYDGGVVELARGWLVVVVDTKDGRSESAAAIDSEQKCQTKRNHRNM